MRPRFAVPAALVAALLAPAVPATAAAAPVRDHGLTISATPNPIVTGEAVLIYGRLNLTHRAGRLVRLYHRVNPNDGFTLVQTTHTDTLGFYEFPRADGVVTSNRNWFVAGPRRTHSRVVHEDVYATLTPASTNPTAGETGQALTFSGAIAPTGHDGEPVVLQELRGDHGDDWSTIGRGTVTGSSYAITHTFAQPGDRELRFLFRGDVRNIRSVSDAFSVTVQQKQNPGFTINTSTPTIDIGQPATLSGTLDGPGSTVNPQPGTSVTLWAHERDRPYAPVAATTTGVDGGYSFTVMPQHNTVYQVRTTFTPPRRRVTTQLIVGVRDAVTIGANAPTATVGSAVTFTGTVTPDKSGHVIYLERKGPDGEWHVVRIGTVNGSSAYRFTYRFGDDGQRTFRARVPGGDSNVGGHSPSVVITVAPAPVSMLAPAL